MKLAPKKMAKLRKEVWPTKKASNWLEVLGTIPTRFYGENTKYNIER